METEDKGYLKSLVEVLKTRDVGALRDFLKREAAQRDSSRVAEIDDISDLDLEIRMYKMILARHELADIHSDARRWLRENDLEDRFG